MISFGEPHPHFLCKPEERRTQQGNRDSEKKTGTIFMLQPEERAGKSNNQEQRRADPTKKGFRNGPLGVKPPSDDLATVIVLPFVVDTRVATSCHQMGAGEPI